MAEITTVSVVPKSLISKDSPMKTFDLEKEYEFRFEVEFDQTVVIKV